MRGLSLVAASGGHSSSRCASLSLSRPLLLQSIGSRRAGSVVVAHGASCSAACAIFPDQGSNPCPLHWQADSQPLRHQGSPWVLIFKTLSFIWGACFLSVFSARGFKWATEKTLRPQRVHQLIITSPLLHQIYPANFSLSQLSKQDALNTVGQHSFPFKATFSTI